jgi:hypothetical protein
VHVIVTERIGQVAHIQFIAHAGLLEKTHNAMEPLCRNPLIPEEPADPYLTNHRTPDATLTAAFVIIW